MLTPPRGSTPELVADVDALVAEHGPGRDAMLPVLLAIRRRHGAVDDAAMQLVADRLGIPPVEVLGVVTFYSFLRGGPARHVARLCRTLVCELAGAPSIAARLERELGVPAGTPTPDGEVMVEWVHCVGLCDGAPAMLVDDEAVDRLTPDAAAAVVARLRRGAEPRAARGDAPTARA